MRACSENAESASGAIVMAIDDDVAVSYVIHHLGLLDYCIQDTQERYLETGDALLSILC